MAFIPTVDADPATTEAPPEATALADTSDLAALRGIVGHFPDGLGALDQMYERMVGQGRLDPTLRLTIIGASARWRSDAFLANAMLAQAVDGGRDADTLARLIEEAEGPEPSSAEAVLLAFCRKVTETAYKTVQRDMDILQASGWANGQIVEAVTMISLSGYLSVMGAVGGLPQGHTPEARPWH